MIHNIDYWTVTNKTSINISYPITGVAFSPIRSFNCIVLYTRLPEEVEHLNIKKRQKLLDYLGIDDPKEEIEDDYPFIITNKNIKNIQKTSMRDMHKYFFHRKFKDHCKKKGIDIMNPHSARHLIGGKIETGFIQMRKINTDIRFWAPDRMTILLK